MLKQGGMMLAAATMALALGTTGARADECSGHNHAGGTVLGAIAGGILGGAIGHGNGGAVVGGALLGGLAGNAISRDMDCEDRPYAERAYHDSFGGPVGQRYEWDHGRDRGYVVTTREYFRHGEPCRDFHQVVFHHGRRLERDGTACRRHGEWEFV